MTFNEMLNQALQKDNQRYPVTKFIWIPKNDWPPSPECPFKVGRSRDYLIQIYELPDSAYRLTVNRTSIEGDGSWEQSITWDELQLIKSMAGFAQSWAIEIYPPDRHIVNAANMRHLWVTDKLPSYIGWRNGR